MPHLVGRRQDRDLAPLRERREWLDAVGSLRGGVSDTGLVQLRSEAKAPFRLTRLIFASGLLFGAAVGLLIIGGRLVQALQGEPPPAPPHPGAPPHAPWSATTCPTPRPNP